MKLLLLIGIGALATALATQAQRPTFTEHVAPVLHRSCMPCHRPGGSAPFTLATYADAQKRARQIGADLATYFMPPCNATTEFGRFCTYPPVTDDETVLISQWAAMGALEGPAEKMPIPPKPPPKWPMGKPDLVLKPGRGIAVAAEGPPHWRTILLPIKLPRGKAIRGLWIEPARPQVLWHVLIFRTTPKTLPMLRARPMPDSVPGPDVLGISAPDMLSAWRAGYRSLDLPKGSGVALKPGEGLAVQALYHPTGRAEDGRFEVGVYLTDDPPYEPKWLTLGTKDIAIPADRLRNFEAERKLEQDVEVLGVHPEAGVTTTNMVLVAVLPDGKVRQLWSVFKWDPIWIGSYRFEKPVRLPKGTALRAVTRIDNSSHNPKFETRKLIPVQYGPGVDDERFWVHVSYLPARQ
jgi:hypothetical protein